MKTLAISTTFFVVALLVFICFSSSSTVNAHDALDLTSWKGVSAQEFHSRNKKETQLHTEAHNNLYHNNAQNQHHIISRIQKSKLTCPECLTIIGLLQEIVASPSSTNLTIGIVDTEVCDKLASKSPTDVKLCKDVVSLAFKTLLPAIFKGLKSLAWNIPQDFCSAIIPVCKNPCCSDAPTAPQQIFLSFANSSDWVSTLSATWTTQVATPGAQIRYGAAVVGGDGNGDGDASITTSTSAEILPTRTYTWSGWVGVVHMAKMSNLRPATEYWYQVGSDASGWSANYTFITLSPNAGQASNPLKVFAIADMGWGSNSNNTLTAMLNMMETNMKTNATPCVIDFVGDLSYSDGNAKGWDVMYRKFQPLFARCFMSFSLGNHEIYDNFTPAKTRLMESMPAAGFGAPAGATYYRQQIGTAHFLRLDSETAIDTPNIDKNQVDWAKKVLAAYPKSAQLPHLVVSHHRPLYCKGAHMQCGLFSDILRGQVEDLYHENKVDLCVNGHIHTKMATWPVYKGEVTQKNYTNPTAPVYTIVGNPGNREGNSGDANGPEWINYGYSTIGFTMMEFKSVNAQHSITVTGYESATGKQLDQIVIEKTL